MELRRNEREIVSEVSRFQTDKTLLNSNPIDYRGEEKGGFF